MGSTIQRRPLRESTALPSSPRIPSSGKASASSSRMNASDSRSAAVTSLPSPFLSVATFPKWRRVISPARVAVRVAKSISWSGSMEAMRQGRGSAAPGHRGAAANPEAEGVFDRAGDADARPARDIFLADGNAGEDAQRQLIQVVPVEGSVDAEGATEVAGAT